VAAYTEIGTRRLALGEVSTAANAASSPAEVETRRLAEAVRALTADRDRLAIRVSALERNLDDVTGPCQARPGPERSGGPNPGASPLPPALVPAPQTTRAPVAPGGPAQSTVPTQAPTQAPVAAASPRVAALAVTPDTAAAASTATRTEFGIDLGTAATVEGLRNLWTAIKSTQAPLLEGLRPVVAVRDGGKPGALELRLV